MGSQPDCGESREGWGTALTAWIKAVSTVLASPSEARLVVSSCNDTHDLMCGQEESHEIHNSWVETLTMLTSFSDRLSSTGGKDEQLERQVHVPPSLLPRWEDFSSFPRGPRLAKPMLIHPAWSCSMTVTVTGQAWEIGNYFHTLILRLREKWFPKKTWFLSSKRRVWVVNIKNLTFPHFLT